MHGHFLTILSKKLLGMFDSFGCLLFSQQDEKISLKKYGHYADKISYFNKFTKSCVFAVLDVCGEVTRRIIVQSLAGSRFFERKPPFVQS